MTLTSNDMNDFDEIIDIEPGADSGSVVPDALIDAVMASVDAGGIELLGENGAIAELTKRLLERGLNEELSDHLGYEAGDPTGRGSGNNRNGTSAKTVLTEIGAVNLDIPRDRNGSFEPQLVPTHSRRMEQFNTNIVHLYARGLSTRDIRRELKRMYHVDVSPTLVSKVTDGIIDELNDWQSRPLDAVYPIMYIDALVVKVRTGGTVINRAAYLGIGVDVEGRKHVLGVWLGDGDEGAKFWLSVLTEIRNRGAADVLLVCCDGLKGLPDAIEATWPKALVQTCVIHLIRASTRFCAYKDRRAVAAALKPIYNAPTVDAAGEAMDDFEIEWGDRYPGIVRTWRSAWEQFTPFLRFPPEIRKIVYTTNMVESINFQLRKVTKTRGHFPTDQSALKLLRLAARNISDKRGGDLGTGTRGWSDALNAFDIHFPGRLGL
jgi:putative transposase